MRTVYFTIRLKVSLVFTSNLNMCKSETVNIENIIPHYVVIFEDDDDEEEDEDDSEQESDIDEDDNVEEEEEIEEDIFELETIILDIDFEEEVNTFLLDMF